MGGITSGLFLGERQAQRVKRLSFVAETLRGKIKRVIDILDEFINIRSKHPGIFKVGYAPVNPTPEPIEPTIARLEKDNPLRNDADPPKDKNFIDRMTQLNDKINALSKS